MEEFAAIGKSGELWCLHQDRASSELGVAKVDENQYEHVGDVGDEVGELEPLLEGGIAPAGVDVRDDLVQGGGDVESKDGIYHSLSQTHLLDSEYAFKLSAPKLFRPIVRCEEAAEAQEDAHVIWSRELAKDQLSHVVLLEEQIVGHDSGHHHKNECRQAWATLPHSQERVVADNTCRRVKSVIE